MANSTTRYTRNTYLIPVRFPIELADQLARLAGSQGRSALIVEATREKLREIEGKKEPAIQTDPPALS